MKPPFDRLRSLHQMLKFYADKYVKILTGLSYMYATLGAYALDGKEISDETVDDAKKFVKDELLPTLGPIGLRQAIKKANYIVEKATKRDIRGQVSELEERIQDELEDGYFLYLSDEEAKLFEPPQPLFGKDFEAQFPSALFELDEASKCRALSRDTAAAFHLMRIVEISLVR